jgi:hypothetical protein
MKVGLALHSLLTGDTDVNTAVSGRVYPELAPEGASMPYLVYSVVNNTPSDAKDGTPIDEAQIEIFSVASTYGSANDLADDVRAALDRKTASVSVDEGDIKVQSIHYTNEVTEVSADRKTYVSIQDYTVRINRVVASAPVDLLLDTYTGAAAAYSLRKLSNSYTGSAIRVRRQSDNTEQDIGFVSNELDTTALATFCSGTNGFVKTWYDQAGSNDATQTTTANQPKIYDSSTGVTTTNGKPAVSFIGINAALLTSDYIFEFSQNEVSAHIVKYALDAGTRDQYMFAEQDATPYSSQFIIGDSVSATGIIWFNATSIGTMNSGQGLVGIEKNSSGLVSTYMNGAFSASASPTINTEIGNTTAFGSRADVTTSFYDGTLQEVIVYKLDNSSNRTGIETNINDFYSIY